MRSDIEHALCELCVAGAATAGCVERQEGHPSACAHQGALCGAALDAPAGAEGRSADGITRRQEVRSQLLIIACHITGTSSRHLHSGYAVHSGCTEKWLNLWLLSSICTITRHVCLVACCASTAGLAEVQGEVCWGKE